MGPVSRVVGMLFEEYYLYRAGDQGYHECRVPALLTTNKGAVLAFNEDYSHVIYSDDHEACYSGDIAFARFDLEWLTNGQDRP
jgi:hypothetical protein